MGRSSSEPGRRPILSRSGKADAGSPLRQSTSNSDYDPAAHLTGERARAFQPDQLAALTHGRPCASPLQLEPSAAGTTS